MWRDEDICLWKKECTESASAPINTKGVTSLDTIPAVHCVGPHLMYHLTLLTTKHQECQQVDKHSLWQKKGFILLIFFAVFIGYRLYHTAYSSLNQPPASTYSSFWLCDAELLAQACFYIMYITYLI